MSEKDLHKAGIEDGNSTNRADNTNTEATPLVFHRIRSCPACGEDDLNLYDFGVFLRSDFLGMRSDGEKGGGRIQLDGDYEYVVMCRSCEHRVFNELSATTEQLMEWAITEGQEIETLKFICPICESKSLSQIRTGVEVIRDVVAVYTLPRDDTTEGGAEIALFPGQVFDYTTGPRYRCAKGHELAKDDGNPVETAEELVAWLKAHSASPQE